MQPIVSCSTEAVSVCKREHVCMSVRNIFCFHGSHDSKSEEPAADEKKSQGTAGAWAKYDFYVTNRRKGIVGPVNKRMPACMRIFDTYAALSICQQKSREYIQIHKMSLQFSVPCQMGILSGEVLLFYHQASPFLPGINIILIIVFFQQFLTMVTGNKSLTLHILINKICMHEYALEFEQILIHIQTNTRQTVLKHVISVLFCFVIAMTIYLRCVSRRRRVRTKFLECMN